LAHPSNGKHNIAEQGRVAGGELLIREAEETEDLVLENGERDIGVWKKQDSCEAERRRVAERASAARELKKMNLRKKNRESNNKAVDDPSLASRSAPLASPTKKTIAPPVKRSSARINAKHKIPKHTQKKLSAMEEVPTGGGMLGKIWGKLEEMIEFVPDATAGGLEETIVFLPDDYNEN
jgi:hypothetical protein